MKMNHPYHPPSAVVPNYVPNSTPTAYVVVAFGALAAAATVPAYYIAGSRAPLKDRLAASWFALCEKSTRISQNRMGAGRTRVVCHSC